MALLIGPEGEEIYLYEHHNFGRKANKVDTQVPGSLVSRVHAVIKWFDDHWQIKDLSTNGTWIDNNKIPGNQFIILKKNTEIRFGSFQSGAFHIADLSAPKDMLIGSVMGKNPKKQLLYLQPYHLLPDEKAPEIALYRQSNQWCIEHLKQNNGVVTVLENDDVITLAGGHWLLRVTKTNELTLPAEPTETALKSAELNFLLSQDEEHCQLTLLVNGSPIDFGKRTHHFLTLALARQWLEDEERPMHANEQGWVYVDQLLNDLGLDESHLNILIHRARKHLADKLHRLMDSSQFIERRTGQLRLGCPNIRIIQGDKQICSASCKAHY